MWGKSPYPYEALLYRAEPVLDIATGKQRDGDPREIGRCACDFRIACNEEEPEPRFRNELRLSQRVEVKPGDRIRIQSPERAKEFVWSDTCLLLPPYQGF